MARGEIRETESVFLYLDGLRPKLPNRQSNDGTVFIAKVIIKKKHTDFFFVDILLVILWARKTFSRFKIIHDV